MFEKLGRKKYEEPELSVLSQIKQTDKIFCFQLPPQNTIYVGLLAVIFTVKKASNSTVLTFSK